MPATEVASSGSTPGMGGKGCPGVAYLASDIDYRFLCQSALPGSKGGGVLSVQVDQYFDEVVKGLGVAGVFSTQVLLPVDPTSHVFVIIELFDKDDAGHCQEYGCL